VKAAKAVVAELDLVPVEANSDLLVPAHLAVALADFTPPPTPQVSLVASIASVVLLRRNTDDLVDPADAGHPLFDPERRGGGLVDLPNHAIVDRGRIVGLWAFDVEAGEIAWATFAAPSPQTREAVALTEAFVRDELGDARAFSLDSPASRVGRLTALRAAAP
jgi:hypothetical protein